MTDKKRILDRAINYLSPRWGAARQMMRTIGGYDSGSRSSSVFQEFITNTSDADTSFNWDAQRIIDRSRDMVRNVPVAGALINRICDHSIGDSGLRCHPQVDAKTLGWTDDEATRWQDETNQEWLLWSESEEADFNRTITFPEKTYLTLKSELEGGDCFTLFLSKKRPGSDYKLKLQTLEGEYCSNPGNTVNTETLFRGIESDAEGVPFRYWFSKNHPGDRTATAKKEDWQGRNIFSRNGDRVILHHYDKIRPGQTRGVPVLGPVTNKLLQLGRLTNAELMAAVINSYYAIVIKGDPKDTQQTLKNPQETQTLGDDERFTLATGAVTRIKGDVEFESFNPDRPNVNYEAFFKTIVTEIGAHVGVPRSLILMSFDKSFSASKGEILLAWAYFLSKRTHIALNLCQPTYERFLDEAVATGKIVAPGYFDSFRIRKAYRGSAFEQWTGPTRPAFDELKEAQAEKVWYELKVKSLTEITNGVSGRDWRKVNEQINRENESKGGMSEENQETLTGMIAAEVSRQAALRGEL
jgi:lambda family phage portal protein